MIVKNRNFPYVAMNVVSLAFSSFRAICSRGYATKGLLEVRFHGGQLGLCIVC